jgi:hypothetical protein
VADVLAAHVHPALAVRAADAESDLADRREDRKAIAAVEESPARAGVAENLSRPLGDYRSDISATSTLSALRFARAIAERSAVGAMDREWQCCCSTGGDEFAIDTAYRRILAKDVARSRRALVQTAACLASLMGRGEPRAPRPIRNWPCLANQNILRR